MRYKGAFGGRSCVHPDTLIDTPSGQVKIKDFEGGEIYSHFEDKIITAFALRSEEYPATQLYEVSLKDGRKIVATAAHRFFTDRGWVELRDLSTSDAFVCGPCLDVSDRPQTIENERSFCLHMTRSTKTDEISQFVRLKMRVKLFVRDNVVDMNRLIGGLYGTKLANMLVSFTGKTLGGFPRLSSVFSSATSPVWVVFSRWLTGREPKRSAFIGTKPAIVNPVLKHKVGGYASFANKFDGWASSFDGLSRIFRHSFSKAAIRACFPSGIVLHREFGTTLDTSPYFEYSPTFWHSTFCGEAFIRTSGSNSFSVWIRKRAIAYAAFCSKWCFPWLSHIGSVSHKHIDGDTSEYVSDNLSLVRIVKVCKHSHQNYWDLHVPIYNNYLSNGIINHNSGKSHHFGGSVIERCVMRPGTRVVCVREVQKSLKDSVMRLLEDKIIAMGLDSEFRVLSDSIISPSNGVILFQGMQDHTAESIKSLEGFDIAYVEEAQTLTSRSLEMLRPTIRKEGSEIWFSWNPRHSTDAVDEFLRGMNPPENSIVVRTNYTDNPFLPKESEEDRIYDEVHNPQRYPHIWLGEYEPQAIGAIWSPDVIHRNRREKAPGMARILVSIDPPISSEEGSDECGIVTGGLGDDGRGYVLSDDSFGKCTPKQWAERAIAAYDLYDADAMVAEINQGGEMVINTIHTIRPNIRVIPVRATRGKHLRAEPVAALYSLDRISHVGHFPKLERQCCLMTAAGYEGDGSPDRVDSLVYLFSELFNKMIKKPRDKKLMPTRATNKYNPHRWKERA